MSRQSPRASCLQPRQGKYRKGLVGDPARELGGKGQRRARGRPAAAAGRFPAAAAAQRCPATCSLLPGHPLSAHTAGVTHWKRPPPAMAANPSSGCASKVRRGSGWTAQAWLWQQAGQGGHSRCSHAEPAACHTYHAVAAHLLLKHMRLMRSTIGSKAVQVAGCAGYSAGSVRVWQQASTNALPCLPAFCCPSHHAAMCWSAMTC